MWVDILLFTSGSRKKYDPPVNFQAYKCTVSSFALNRRRVAESSKGQNLVRVIMPSHKFGEISRRSSFHISPVHAVRIAHNRSDRTKNRSLRRNEINSKHHR